MFCMNCGTKLPDGARFCFSCGAPCSANVSSGAPQTRKMMPDAGRTQLVAAKCTNCGAALQVNPDMKSAECPYCHYTYMVDQAINNYNISLSGDMHVDNATINVAGISEENYIKRAKEFSKKGQIKQALEYFEHALDINPNNDIVKKKIETIKTHVFFSEENVLGRVLFKDSLLLKYEKITLKRHFLGEEDDYSIYNMDVVKKGLFSTDEFWYQGKKIEGWQTARGTVWRQVIEDAKRGIYPILDLDNDEIIDPGETELETYIFHNFSQTDKIKAIKYYREQKGCELNEAKEAIDVLWSKRFGQ